MSTHLLSFPFEYSIIDFQPEFHPNCLDTRAYEYFQKANVLNKEGDPRKAFELLVEAIHIPGGICDPNFRALLYQCKATTLYNQGIFEEALKTAEQAQKIPGFSHQIVQFNFHFLKAYAYRQLQMNAEASEEAKKGMRFGSPSLQAQRADLILLRTQIFRAKNNEMGLPANGLEDLVTVALMCE